GPITIDRAAHRVTLRGEEVSLTVTEYKLLTLLLERRGRVQSRPHLLEHALDAQPDLQTRTVDMHIQRLRAKLGDQGEMLETVRGAGYRIRPREPAAWCSAPWPSWCSRWRCVPSPIPSRSPPSSRSP